MKKFLIVVSISILFFISFTSCEDDSSYASLLSKEKSSISNYIKRNNLQVTETLPANNAWSNNLYYKNSDGIYIHINSRDSASVADNDTVKLYRNVIYRYQKWTIDEDSTLVATSIDSNEPNIWQYGVTTASEYFVALAEAFAIMRYNGTTATVIVPSKLGTSDDIDDVIPYRYEFKSFKLE